LPLATSVGPTGGEHNAAPAPASASGSASRAFAWVPPAVLGLVAIAWITGAVLLLIRLLLAWTAANRLRRRATLIDPSPLRETFERLSAGAGVQGTSLAVSTEVDAPVVVGVRAPAVLVPAHLLEFMPDDGLAPILAHEITHVVRGDYAANLAQSIFEAFMCHSPAIWWMGARIREAREFCCDDVSVDVAGDTARYVEALTLVARLGTVQHARPAVGMAGPRLITRVRRLLEGEPTMSMQLVRASLATAAIVIVSAALPLILATASRQLSAQLLAAGRTVQGAAVPYGYPQRQEGSALRIRTVSSTEAHVCGAFEVENLASVAVTQVRFVGVLSFKPGTGRVVVIRESEWLARDIPAGGTALVHVPLIELEEARREARGEHVQAHCALREVVYANRAAWSMTPNPSATTDIEALGLGRWPTLPRDLVGQSRVAAYPRLTLCLDDKGAEHSSGAQLEIRDEPGRAARCAPTGQWVEVDRRTGEPVPGAQAELTLDVTVDGLPAAMALKSAVGRIATLRLGEGRTFGLVPTVAANGDVSVSLHDMSAMPHSLLGTRTLRAGSIARFDDALPVVSVRLASR
jgi:beta-lactamase regulating signal transducer with metallopeptidase domain